MVYTLVTSNKDLINLEKNMRICSFELRPRQEDNQIRLCHLVSINSFFFRKVSINFKKVITSKFAKNAHFSLLEIDDLLPYT